MATLQSRLTDLSNAIGSDMKAKVGRGEGWIDLRKQTGIVGNGTTDDSTAIQTALDSALALGLKVYAYGSFRINSKITITSNVDFEQATFNYGGTGVAIQVGLDASVTFRIHVLLPSVINVLKSGLGWSSVVGTTGVKIVNTNGCVIQGPTIRNFAIGLLVTGLGRGNSYNRILFSIIENCQIGQDIVSDATGWSNENRFTISLISFYSNEGASVSGTRCIRLQTSASIPNNNVWTGGSVEGDTAEYHLECAGGDNRFEHMRWENGVTGCRVLWKTGAYTNLIDHGYGAHLITQSRETNSGTHTILTRQSWRLGMSAGTKGVFQLENSSSSANPAFVLLTAGAMAANADPVTEYAAAWSADKLSLKRPTEAYDRLQLDAVNSRLYFGSGSVAPTRYISNLGTSALSVAGGNWCPAATATLDLGIDTFRWRDIYLSQHLRLGTLYLRDNAGTFEKSTNGTTWSAVDTTGSTDITGKVDKVGTSDIEITDTTKGVILKSPDGARWRITVGNDGALTTTVAP